MPGPSRPRTAKLRGLAGVTVVTVGVIAGIPAPAQAAAVVVPCSETALVGAINTANAAPGDDTLNLAAGCTYGLTSSHGNAGNGPVGLPVITSVIELVGTPNIITRSGGVFRIAEVSSTGNLTLTRVTLDNGSTSGSGGGVLNRGAVTFTSSGSGLTNNSAGLLGTGGGLSNADTPGGTAPAATFTGATVSGNSAGGIGGGIYNGLRSALSVTSSVVTMNASVLQGGGIASINSTTTLTSTPISVNSTVLLLGAGGVYRSGGTMTTNTSPISSNTPTNCVGSSPPVPNCTA
jgi:hypothetical protein